MTSATRRMRARVENRRSAQKYRNSFAGKQTVILPANVLEAFGDAFKLVKGRG